jgi:nicotinate-nucleotide adenylyltransferase
MAEAAAEQLQLHRVYFVPTSRNPLKSQGPSVATTHRLEMLRLGISDNPRFSVWEGELYRDGPSYTLHSVEHIERVYPNAHLFWIIGSDHLPELSRWHGIERLVQKVAFILVQRPGYAFEWPRIPGLTVFPVDNPLNPVSATEVRLRARNGDSLEGLIPSPVEAYIREHGLYRD